MRANENLSTGLRNYDLGDTKLLNDCTRGYCKGPNNQLCQSSPLPKSIMQTKIIRFLVIGFFFLSISNLLFSQNGVVKGNVYDAISQDGIAGAYISVIQLFFNEKYIDFKKGDIQSLSPIQRNPKGYVAQSNDFSRSNFDFQLKQAPPNLTFGFSYDVHLKPGSPALGKGNPTYNVDIGAYVTDTSNGKGNRHAPGY